MNRLLLVLMLAVLLLPACRKNEEPSPFWGTASAWFNGENWNELRGWPMQVGPLQGLTLTGRPASPASCTY